MSKQAIKPARQRAPLRIRVALHQGEHMGPGKADLLEAIDRTGSIAAGGRTLGMSYTRAWALVQVMNGCFKRPLVTPMKGGKAGGGAKLTASGHTVLRSFRQIEADAALATDRNVALLLSLARNGKAK